MVSGFKDFQKLIGPLLIDAIQVRHQEDLVEQPLLELPSTKGTVEKIITENIPGNSVSKYYRKWAFDRKDHVVKADTDPGEASPVIIEFVSISSPIRIFADNTSLSRSSFEVISAFVRTMCANRIHRGGKCEHILTGLNADTFAKVLLS